MIRAFLVLVALMLADVVCGQNLTKLDSLLKKLDNEKSDTAKINLYYRISHELQFSSPDQALTWAEKALQESEKSGYRQGKANSLVQLGNIEQLAGNYDKAGEYNLKALKIFEKNGPGSGVAICYNNLGIIAHSRSDYSMAVDYYRRSLSLNRALKRRSGEATSLFCIGTVFENTSRYDSAMVYYLMAEEISEETGDNKLKAYARISLGNLYYSTGDMKKSAHYNLEAADIYLKEGNDLGLVKVYNSLGQVFTAMNDLAEATKFYNMALSYSLKLGSKSNISNAYYYLAEVYEMRELTDSAFFFYNYAYDSFSAIEDNENAVYALIAMARIENREKRFKSASSLLSQALGHAENIGNPLPLKEIYRELSLNAAGSGDFRNAWLYQNTFEIINDSVMNVEKQKQILDLQTKYETEKKEKENEILKKDRRILIITRSFLITGVLLMAVIAMIILRSLRIKKRDNRLLREQKLEIASQRDIVEQQKREITDSIRYAQRIQSAMLTPPEIINEVIHDSFVLYLPRDIVSGDFYYLKETPGGKVIMCAADCTGHGVPGAMMSMLGISLLTEIIDGQVTGIDQGVIRPSDILNRLRQRIKESLRQTGRDTEAKDGMDMAFCIFDKHTRELRYSGANNPIYYVTRGELSEIKATRNPIGIYLAETEFIEHEITIPENTTLYLFSDGYVDQINPNGNKFMSKNFRKLLRDIASHDMKEQRETLLRTHLEFRQQEEQVDDILIIGVRL